MNRRQAIAAIGAGGAVLGAVTSKAFADDEKKRGDTAPKAAPALTPEQAMRPSNGAAVTVEIQVLSVRNYDAYDAATIALDFRASVDGKQDQFIVVLPEKVQAQLKRVGAHDLDRHFRGKRVRVVGPVSAARFTGLDDRGTHFRLRVETLDQFEQVD